MDLMELEIGILIGINYANAILHDLMDNMRLSLSFVDSFLTYNSVSNFCSE
jgi:hypothetical protein